MSGLLDAVKAAIYLDGVTTVTADEGARAAVEAVAAWLDGGEPSGYSPVASLLRAEVAPPRRTAEDVIRSVGTWACDVEADAIAAALRDAGMLREDGCTYPKCDCPGGKVCAP